MPTLPRINFFDVEAGRIDRQLSAWGSADSEAGFPDLEFGSWNGLLVPVGTPKPIIAKINAVIAKVRDLPDIRQRMTELGFTPEGGSPDGAFVTRDLGRWQRQ